MIDVTVAILIAGWIVSLLYSKYVIRSYINPVLLFTTAWLIAFSLFAARLLNYYPLEEKTCWVISIGYLSYVSGLMIPFLFFRPLTRSRIDFASDFPHRRFKVMLYVAYFLGLTGFYLLYMEISNYFSLSDLFDPLKYRLLRVMLLEEKIGGRLVDYLVLWGEIALVFSIFYSVYFKKKWIRVYIFFIPTIAYSLFSTGRSQIFAFLIAFFGSYLFVKNFLVNEPIKRYVYVLLPLLLIFSFGGIGVLLSKHLKFTRHIDTENILQSQLYMLYYYMTSAFGALNKLVLKESFALDLGKNILAPILRLVHTIYPDVDAPAVFQEFTSTPYRSNVYTYIRVIYKDFGIVGVAIAPFFIGSLISTIWGRLSHHKNILYLPLVCHLMFITFMTIFEDLFFRTTPLLILLYTFLFLKLSGLKYRGKAAGEEAE